MCFKNMNKNNQKIENLFLDIILFIFFLISLVPFHALTHIRILNLPLHYLIGGISVGIISAVIWFYQQKKITFFDKWLFILILSFSLSLITSVDRLYTLWTIASFFIRGIGVAFIASRIIKTSIDREKAISILIFVGTVVSLIGIAEFLLHRNPLYHELFFNRVRYYTILGGGGISSTFGHYLPLGVYLVLLLPVSVYFWQENRYFYSVIPFVSIFSAIILTFSRSAWISGILCLIIYFLCKENFRIIKKTILVCLMIIILPFLFSSSARQIFFAKFNPGTFKIELLDSHRTASYLTTWNILKKYPFFGVGLGNYPKVHKVYKAEKALLEYDTPDNMYLRLISETGIVGILTFLGFFIFVIRQILLNIQFYKNTTEGNLFRAFFSGIIGFLLNLIVGDFFYWLAPQFLFWFMLGIGVGIKGSSCEDG